MTNVPESKAEVTSSQYFEALNRTYSALIAFDALVLGLSVLRNDSDLSQKAGEIRSNFWDLYQLLSTKYDSTVAGEETKP